MMYNINLDEKCIFFHEKINFFFFCRSLVLIILDFLNIIISVDCKFFLYHNFFLLSHDREMNFN